MKRCWTILLAVVMVTAMFSACAANDTSGVTPSASQTPAAPPDFSGTDFTGTWGVSQVLDSLGAPVSEEKRKEIGADYTIELLEGGMYIICSAEGKEIGQGQYSVAQDALTFSAGGGETVYTIRDENTIQCTAQDGSVTVMTRCCTDTSGNEEGEAAASPDDTNIETAPAQSS